jgi:hypothetical protein
MIMPLRQALEDVFEDLSPLVKENTKAIKENLLTRASSISNIEDDEKKAQVLRGIINDCNKVLGTEAKLGKLFNELNRYK